MKQVIQHILFPDDESLYDYRDMFYHGDRGGSQKGQFFMSRKIRFC